MDNSLFNKMLKVAEEIKNLPQGATLKKAPTHTVNPNTQYTAIPPPHAIASRLAAPYLKKAYDEERDPYNDTKRKILRALGYGTLGAVGGAGLGAIAGGTLGALGGRSIGKDLIKELENHAGRTMHDEAADLLKAVPALAGGIAMGGMGGAAGGFTGLGAGTTYGAMKRRKKEQE